MTLTQTLRPDLSIFVHRVGDLVRQPPITCPGGTSVAEAADRMWRQGLGAVIVVDAEGGPIGIVTDRDLRQKVVAARRDPSSTTVAQIMSTPLTTIDAGAYASEAAIAMTRAEIHHLPVIDDGRLIGVVSSHDLFVMQSAHPVMLARAIGTAASLDALVAVSQRVTALVRRLVRQGASAYDVARIVAELNDRLVQRVLTLSMEALAAAGDAPPPLDWCWLVLGSEGRREQTLRTDQDNGLVYADPPPELAEAAARSFHRFGQTAIAGLVRVGFPLCPGGAMASNPRWCQPLSVWKGYFRGWMSSASPDNVLAASIYFDLRALSGATGLGTVLVDLVRSEAPRQTGLLGTMARDVVGREIPLTLLGNIRVPRRGPHGGRIDVKATGTMTVVGAARLLALQLGLAETNTIDRLRAASAAGALGGADLDEISDAYQLLMRLRLRHQLDQLDRGETPDNLVEPGRLSRADALLLRDAFRTVRNVQAAIRERFATDFAR